jgi:hypothetical protein
MGPRSVFEPLELRRLLSAAANHAVTAAAQDELPDVAPITWNNVTAPAVEGQWVVQLGGYQGTKASQTKKAERLLGAVNEKIEVSDFLLKNGQFTINLPADWSTQDQYAVLTSLPRASVRWNRSSA